MPEPRTSVQLSEIVKPLSNSGLNHTASGIGSPKLTHVNVGAGCKKFRSAKLITSADLQAHTKSDLVKMAKRLGVTGYANMLKGQLVSAVAKASQAKAQPKKKAKAKPAKKATPKKRVTASTSAKTSTKSASKSVATKKKKVATKTKAAPKTVAKSKPAAKKAVKKKAAVKTAVTKAAKPKKLAAKKAPAKPKPKPTNPRILKRIRELQLQRDSDRDIAFRPTLIKPPGSSEPIWEKEPQRDRIALFVRDAFWMHASWDITRQAIERAKAAMAEQWHASRPVLRLLRLEDDDGSSVETIERDIDIHGGLRNWYIEWNGSSATFRVMIGYLAPTGRFHAISESNIVSTPAAGSPESVDDHWTQAASESEKIFSLSGGYDDERETAEMKQMLEERIHRTLGAPALAKLGAGNDSPFRKKNNFHFDMDIELVLYGSTVPDGYLTLNGEPVTLREDGTFVLRFPFPDRRQVLPAVACSRDGSQTRTIVVAVERNTKIMEPLDSEKDTGD